MKKVCMILFLFANLNLFSEESLLKQISLNIDNIISEFSSDLYWAQGLKFNIKIEEIYKHPKIAIPVLIERIQDSDIYPETEINERFFILDHMLLDVYLSSHLTSEQKNRVKNIYYEKLYDYLLRYNRIDRIVQYIDACLKFLSGKEWGKELYDKPDILLDRYQSENLPNLIIYDDFILK